MVCKEMDALNLLYRDNGTGFCLKSLASKLLFQSLKISLYEDLFCLCGEAHMELPGYRLLICCPHLVMQHFTCLHTVNCLHS